MKKSLKSLALVLAVVLLVSVFPFSAFAADTLGKKENIASDAEYYSITLQNQSTTSEYISFQYTGVDKNTKTLTVKENEPITITMDDGSGYTGQNGDQNGYALGWYYSSGSSRCISTDAAFTMTNGDYTFDVSGFGTAENQNTVIAENGNTAKTTFTLNSGLPAGDYEFTVTYKYQMKRENWGWRAQQEITTSDTIYIHVEKEIPAEYYPNALGSSVCISKAGIRFGFNSEVTDATEYGFLYTYAATDSLVEGAEGVNKFVATNVADVTEEGTGTPLKQYNLVFTDVPESGFNTDITVCAYVVIDGETYYSEPITRNLWETAQSIINDSGVDEATKNAVKNIIGVNA